ncbi:DUF2997 domain-containing protein [Gimesia maris]|uniref:DUF2997 domain-containing protein n=1 Tax=Gimesia maris TaxID=122 RepID=A0ABX5YNJ0_9PLAN|nr:DUF2997 domain-containing protein [Gimesia maris]EDL62288.1 hypothetical protein PM8797T_28209 [Gimesia maris DSM 8797]QEG17311.1 hypothetical protein GmarT_31910 [Gimesia maris]QGQ29594.1 DUF2997 domain-containing protein [Gimesia maris]
MNQTIEIIITADGQTRVETKGFTGSDCRIASRFLEQALGQTTSEILKPEFYLSASEEEHVQEGL